MIRRCAPPRSCLHDLARSKHFMHVDRLCRSDANVAGSLAIEGGWMRTVKRQQLRQV